MTLYREYKHIEGNKYIKFTISFNKEQISWATGQPKKIGYQVTAHPITREEKSNGIIIESFGAFTGFNDNLIEVDRQSKKRLETAINTLNERMEIYMNYFKNKYNNE